MADENPPPRPTLRALAKLAGLSATAVSMALRNNPRIPAVTRARVQRLAKKQGYRPDPEVVKLMLHLRRRRVVRAQATLCGLTNWPAGSPSPYIDPLVRSARLRAKEQGYNFDVIQLEPYAGSSGALERVLRSRGVQGVLLLTLTSPASLAGLLDWSRFSVVATSYSVLNPVCHRVLPHHFENAMLAFRTLIARGYKRIGLVLSEGTDLRTNHCYTAAIAWHQKFGLCERVKPLIRVTDSVQALRQWLAEEKPDVVAGEWSGGLLQTVRAIGKKVPAELAVVSLSSTANQELAHIDERPAAIGATAVDIVAAMVLRSEQGLPAAPQVTMVEGRWVDGATV